MRKILPHAWRAALTFGALFGFWLLLVGTNAGLEEIAAGASAAIGAVAALSVRGSGLLDAKADPRMLLKTAKLPLQIAVELWWLVAALARGRRPHGGYVATPFAAGGDDAESKGRRAIAGIADTISPNVIFLDADCERDLALRHALDLDHVPDSIP